jgi:hypothetical protein
MTDGDGNYGPFRPPRESGCPTCGTFPEELRLLRDVDRVSREVKVGKVGSVYALDNAHKRLDEWRRAHGQA